MNFSLDNRDPEQFEYTLTRKDRRKIVRPRLNHRHLPQEIRLQDYLEVEFD